MTGEPENAPPLARVVMPDLRQHGYWVYPLVDHVADKICALFERHGASQAPSARYKDLVDLVAIVLVRSVEASPRIAALRSEAGRRRLELPQRLVVPDRALWETGYAAEARRSLLPSTRTLAEARTVVSRFADPLRRGCAGAGWSPA
ncbi:MAG: nucleotidyl transferase AbiEii/AbiGii toxin family protein [Streptosporangiaceae bacterium]